MAFYPRKKYKHAEAGSIALKVMSNEAKEGFACLGTGMAKIYADAPWPYCKSFTVVVDGVEWLTDATRDELERELEFYYGEYLAIEKPGAY